MDCFELLAKRHSVRSYDGDRPIAGGVLSELEACIARCNTEGRLHMQLVLNEPKCFGGFMAHYGKFSGVKNYIALVGRAEQDLDERCGFYGEQVVLEAQRLGLNTCWVALTYSRIKTAFQIEKGEKLCLVIAAGYGLTQGSSHPIKPREAIMKVHEPPPEWFLRGIDAALLAPSSMNQQKYAFSLEGNRVSASARAGFYSKIDLGIAKYHFELGAGREHFEWA